MAKSKWEQVKTKLTLVEGWARDGLTDEQIAKNLGISKALFYKYRIEHIEFLESLKKGKEVADYEVENALFKRALGYDYEEVTYEKGVISKIVKKHMSPDTTAQIFWLKNRRPDKWRDKQEEKVSTESKVVIVNDLPGSDIDATDN